MIFSKFFVKQSSFIWSFKTEQFYQGSAKNHYVYIAPSLQACFYKYPSQI